MQKERVGDLVRMNVFKAPNERSKIDSMVRIYVYSTVCYKSRMIALVLLSAADANWRALLYHKQ